MVNINVWRAIVSRKLTIWKSACCRGNKICSTSRSKNRKTKTKRRRKTISLDQKCDYFYLLYMYTHALSLSLSLSFRDPLSFALCCCYCCLWFFEIDFNIYRYHLRCGVNVFIRLLVCLFGIWLDCVSEMLILVLTIIKINCIIISYTHKHTPEFIMLCIDISQRPIQMGLFDAVMLSLSLFVCLIFWVSILGNRFGVCTCFPYFEPLMPYKSSYYLSYVHKSLSAHSVGVMLLLLLIVVFYAFSFMRFNWVNVPVRHIHTSIYIYFRKVNSTKSIYGRVLSRLNVVSKRPYQENKICEMTTIWPV